MLAKCCSKDCLQSDPSSLDPNPGHSGLVCPSRRQCMDQDRDLMAIGMQGLLDIVNQQRTGPPPISATWVSESGTPFLPRPKSLKSIQFGGRHRTVRENGGRPLVSRWRTSPVERSGHHQRDIENTARRFGLIVALSNLNDADNQRLTTEVPNLTLLLSTKGT